MATSQAQPSTEQTPLLPDPNGLHGDSADEHSPSELPVGPRLKVILPCLLVLFLIGTSFMLADGPVPPILENLICQTYYPDVIDPNTDPRCKSTIVAASLANLFSWQILFAFLPSVLLSVPYGVMADKSGRKVVLFLSLVGMILYFALFSVIASFPGRLSYWWSLALGVFFLIGGGPATATTMVFTMIGDVTPAEQKATVFFYLNAAVLSGFLVATPLLAWLLKRGNWLPLFIGLAGIVLCAILAMLLPETRHPTMLNRLASSNRDTAAQDQKTSYPATLWTSFLSTFSTSVSAVRRYCFGDNKRIALLFLAITFNIFGHDVVVISLMYTVKVFGLSWADATALSTVQTAMSLVVLLIILPLANQVLLKFFSMTAMRKDLSLARVSIAFLAVGYLSQGLAPTVPAYIVAIVVSSIGLGFPALLRSLISASAHGEDLGTLYSMITVIENLGSLIAGPGMLQLFSVGVKQGGYWRGLPFYFAGGLLTISMILVFLFRLPKEEEADPEERTSDISTDRIV